MQSKNMTSGSGTAVNARAEMLGYSVTAGGSTAVVKFRDTGASGTVWFHVSVPANTCDCNIFSFGVPFDGQIYVEIVSGSPSNVAVFWE